MKQDTLERCAVAYLYLGDDTHPYNDADKGDPALYKKFFVSIAKFNDVKPDELCAYVRQHEGLD